MKMVVTLRNGVQIKMDVEEFSTGQSPIFGELRSLKWTGLGNGSNEIVWLSLSDVVAVHSERLPVGDRFGPRKIRPIPGSGADERQSRDDDETGGSS